MPRAPSKTNKTPIKRAQPYPSSSPISDDSEIKPSDVGDDIKPQAKSAGKKGGGESVWTGAELNQLFEFALVRNGRGWEGAVPGRTADQARQTWCKRVMPFIKNALETKGDASGSTVAAAH